MLVHCLQPLQKIAFKQTCIQQKLHCLLCHSAGHFGSRSYHHLLVRNPLTCSSFRRHTTWKTHAVIIKRQMESMLCHLTIFTIGNRPLSAPNALSTTIHDVASQSLCMVLVTMFSVGRQSHQVDDSRGYISHQQLSIVMMCAELVRYARSQATLQQYPERSSSQHTQLATQLSENSFYL